MDICNNNLRSSNATDCKTPSDSFSSLIRRQIKHFEDLKSQDTPPEANVKATRKKAHYSFTAEIRCMMHTSGDVANPLMPTVRAVQKILREQMNVILCKATEIAHLRKQGTKFITQDDLLYIMRLNKMKLRRLIRYLNVKDTKDWIAKKDQSAIHDIYDDIENGRRVKKTMEYLRKLNSDEFSSVMKDAPEDRIIARRKQRNNLMTLYMNEEEYKLFYQKLQVSFFPKGGGLRFKKWILQDKVTKLIPNPFALEILNYLARETITEIVELCLIVKNIENSLPMLASDLEYINSEKENAFNIPVPISQPETPSEGKKGTTKSASRKTPSNKSVRDLKNEVCNKEKKLSSDPSSSIATPTPKETKISDLKNNVENKTAKKRNLSKRVGKDDCKTKRVIKDGDSVADSLKCSNAKETRRMPLRRRVRGKIKIVSKDSVDKTLECQILTVPEDDDYDDVEDIPVEKVSKKNSQSSEDLKDNEESGMNSSAIVCDILHKTQKSDIDQNKSACDTSNEPTAYQNKLSSVSPSSGDGNLVSDKHISPIVQSVSHQCTENSDTKNTKCSDKEIKNSINSSERICKKELICNIQVENEPRNYISKANNAKESVRDSENDCQNAESEIFPELSSSDEDSLFDFDEKINILSSIVQKLSNSSEADIESFDSKASSEDSDLDYMNNSNLIYDNCGNDTKNTCATENLNQIESKKCSSGLKTNQNDSIGSKADANTEGTKVDKVLDPECISNARFHNQNCSEEKLDENSSTFKETPNSHKEIIEKGPRTNLGELLKRYNDGLCSKLQRNDSLEDSRDSTDLPEEEAMDDDSDIEVLLVRRPRYSETLRVISNDSDVPKSELPKCVSVENSGTSMDSEDSPQSLSGNKVGLKAINTTGSLAKCSKPSNKCVKGSKKIMRNVSESANQFNGEKKKVIKSCSAMPSKQKNITPRFSKANLKSTPPTDSSKYPYIFEKPDECLERFLDREPITPQDVDEAMRLFFMETYNWKLKMHKPQNSEFQDDLYLLAC